jgi:SAM-dependent methyltransferase
MAEADRRRWNERYAQGEIDLSPVPRLVHLERFLRPAPGAPARALDVACGAGRNALYLAGLGYTVDAWDVSEAGLAHLTRAAQEGGLASQVQVRQIDLDGAQLPVAQYGLALDTYFLDRRLLPAMAAAVKPGGLLFMETLLSTPQKPGRPDYYLQPGELRAAFPSYAELFYEENTTEGWAALLARRLPDATGEHPT